MSPDGLRCSESARPDSKTQAFLENRPASTPDQDNCGRFDVYGTVPNSSGGERKTEMAGWVILGILVVVGFMLAGMYNQLVQLRVRTDSAWSDIDVQLTRRRDLLPGLVETMKRYAAREKDRFEDLAKCRSLAIEASTPAEKAQAENQLTGALKNLLAVAENYPDLKANQTFVEVEASLCQTEDAIQSACRFYNALVRDLNARIQSFPSNILARIFGFHERQFFDFRAAEREPVAVKF